MDRPIKILLAGEGGQGIQTIGKLLASAAFAQGFETIYIPNFGVEQRGGVSIAYVQIWDKQIDAPKFQIADFALITSDRAYDRVRMHIGKDTKLIYDSSSVKISVPNIKQAVLEAIDVPAFETARVQLTVRSANVILLGAVADLSSVVSRETLQEEMHKKFEKYYAKNPELKDLNEQAFRLGERFIPGGETGEE